MTNRSGTCTPFNPSSCIIFRWLATSDICSLQITTISVALFPMKILINLSMSRSPLTFTNGLGSVIPSWASREPSPAAIIANFIPAKIHNSKEISPFLCNVFLLKDKPKEAFQALYLLYLNSYNTKLINKADKETHIKQQLVAKNFITKTKGWKALKPVKIYCL